MHGISIAWNGYETVFHYLDMYYDVLIQGKEFPKHVTVINLCINHYIKIVWNHVKSNVNITIKDHFKSGRIFIMKSIGVLFDLKDMAQVEEWFQLFVTILSSKVAETTLQAKKDMEFLHKNI